MLNTSEPTQHHKRLATFSMSFKDRSQAVIDFLASGELYTTRPVVAALLNISNASAARLLHALVRDGILKVDETEAHANLYSISRHWLAFAEIPHLRARAFELNPTAERMVNHHTCCQFVRIEYMDSAALAKKCYWITGNVLFGNKMMKKVPDAIFIDPEKNRKTAIEIELYMKSAEQTAKDVGDYLWDIESGYYSDVVYHSPYPETRRLDLGQALRANAASVSAVMALRDGTTPVFSVHPMPLKQALGT